ncbi:eCIS core domain-containing protein [Nostoc sp. 'Lobaria pulmonaria (5183) cyanobiont']|uniref:eCIS core domain-containing protein n=1 Tax=Nostoc sp. 'Lobaria pulmonaria (5183) cyanobiont' TaxID=1618022 RepID=UPI000CF32CD3|nr:DUF4157 domain-containing protein [Nostoc sp. 'Lobaria pulmonaria (5183) cyanobiont']AVH73343.1 hypothetical protein NLP_4982 [Nostoc sp. 'Lobaria pulmonaria (5183) cyanobiont']
MREHISRQKKNTTGFSIPSLKHPIRGFGLESSAISRQAVPEIQPLTHDISRIPLRTQAKLSISQPGDIYEQEADSVAQQVMQRMAQPVNRQSIQREALPEDEEELQMKSLDNSTLQREALPEDEEELQMKSLDNSTLQRQEVPEDEEELQMKPMAQRQGEAVMAGAPDLEASINQARDGGQVMADNIREPMEQAFGADFSGVKVHTDGQSDQLNRSIQARAFTTGQDVFFRQGEYNPGSRGGQELLAHELTHVVQQSGGAVQRSPLPPQQFPQHPATEALLASVGDRVIQGKGEKRTEEPKIKDISPNKPRVKLLQQTINPTLNRQVDIVQRVMIGKTNITSDSEFVEISEALNWNKFQGIRIKLTSDQMQALVTELADREDCKEIVEELKETLQPEEDESESSDKDEYESEEESAENFKFQDFPSVKGNYKLIGVHETRSKNVNSLVANGISSDMMGSGHGLGKGTGFYILPVYNSNLKKSIEGLRWGTRFVAVYINQNCTLKRAEDGENMETLENKSGGNKYYYEFGKLEHVIPESLFGEVKLARLPNDI